MKTVKLNSKLSLNKETIAKLNNQQMNVIMGGTMSITCETACGDICLISAASCKNTCQC